MTVRSRKRARTSPCLFGSALLLLSWSAPACAAANQWVQAGLQGLVIGSILVDPSAASHLIVGTDGGVFESTDSGASWAHRTQGLADPYVYDLAFDTGGPRTVYAGTHGGVSRSTDGGTTWTPASAGLPGSDVFALAGDPTASMAVYAGTSAGVFRSTDAGATWAARSAGLVGSVSALATDSKDGAVYAGTTYQGVFKSTDGGATWNSKRTNLGNWEITALAVDPATPSTVYAGTAGDGVYVSTDGGGTWAKTGVCISSTPCFPWVGAIAIDPVLPSTLFVGSAASGVFTSQNRGQTWTPMNRGIETLYVTALSVVRDSGLRIYAGSMAQGLFVFEFDPATKLVPIVLDAPGQGGARYGTELTLTNRGTTDATVRLTYTAAEALDATGSGSVTEVLAAGRQLVTGDAIAYLRAKGLAIPPGDASQGGTLLVTFDGLSLPNAAYVGARTTTPSGGGRAGLSYPGLGPVELSKDSVFVVGLEQNQQYRGNLALVNGSPDSSAVLGVTLFSTGQSGPQGRALPDVHLGPGQWTQLGRVLEPFGFEGGYARVNLVSGSGPFFAYGVVNDNVTNDGSFIACSPQSGSAEPQLLPVLVETPTFASDLILANPTALALTVSMHYVESLNPDTLGRGGTAEEVLAPNEQRVIGDAVEYLRGKGVPLGARNAGNAGALSVTFQAGGQPVRAFAGARVTASSPTGGGYGLYFQATGLSQAATTEAWIFGLQQNDAARSNVAVANFGDQGDIAVWLEVYDGTTGVLAGFSNIVSLPAGRWTQFSGVLSGFGVANGYVCVRRVQGASRFLAYGVVNDGSAPGRGTSDGSYVSMVIP